MIRFGNGALHRITNFFAYLKTVGCVTISRYFYTIVNPIKDEIAVACIYLLFTLTF